jgi:hypothetical protein
MQGLHAGLGASTTPDEAHLDYHIYLDPPTAEDVVADVSPAQAALSRCRAGRLAILSRLEPRLRAHVWEREPFQLWVWDPAAARPAVAASRRSSCLLSEPHLWGRMETGDGTAHDEWLVVGILLRLSAEQPDVTVTVRNSTEGEMMLVEAAYCLP